LVHWFSEQLTDGHAILCPIIEALEAPTYKMWKKLFQREFDRINTPLVLVRHSLGGSILLKYLSEEKPKIAVSALFLISTPLWGKYGWDVDDFVLPDNFENVAPGIKHIYLYHCKEDNIVPFSHLNFYKSAL